MQAQQEDRARQVCGARVQGRPLPSRRRPSPHSFRLRRGARFSLCLLSSAPGGHCWPAWRDMPPGSRASRGPRCRVGASFQQLSRLALIMRVRSQEHAGSASCSGIRDGMPRTATCPLTLSSCHLPCHNLRVLPSYTGTGTRPGGLPRHPHLKQPLTATAQSSSLQRATWPLPARPQSVRGHGLRLCPFTTSLLFSATQMFSRFF